MNRPSIDDVISLLGQPAPPLDMVEKANQLLRQVDTIIDDESMIEMMIEAFRLNPHNPEAFLSISPLFVTDPPEKLETALRLNLDNARARIPVDGDSDNGVDSAASPEEKDFLDSLIVAANFIEEHNPAGALVLLDELSSLKPDYWSYDARRFILHLRLEDPTAASATFPGFESKLPRFIHAWFDVINSFFADDENVALAKARYALEHFPLGFGVLCFFDEQDIDRLDDQIEQRPVDDPDDPRKRLTELYYLLSFDCPALDHAVDFIYESLYPNTKTKLPAWPEWAHTLVGETYGGGLPIHAVAEAIPDPGTNEAEGESADPLVGVHAFLDYVEFFARAYPPGLDGLLYPVALAIASHHRTPRCLSAWLTIVAGLGEDAYESFGLLEFADIQTMMLRSSGPETVDHLEALARGPIIFLLVRMSAIGSLQHLHETGVYEEARAKNMIRELTDHLCSQPEAFMSQLAVVSILLYLVKFAASQQWTEFKSEFLRCAECLDDDEYTGVRTFVNKAYAEPENIKPVETATEFHAVDWAIRFQESVAAALQEAEDEYEERREQEAVFKQALAESKMTQANHENHKKVGRNDPCPCGSGKKYKKCCF